MSGGAGGGTAAGSDEHFLERAVELATKNVAEGGGPFGAVLVRGGELLATGQNRVTRDNDPTAHAEVQAVRAACRLLGTFSLHGTTLYSSCEPCPMCLASALWARVDRVVYAADRDDAARGGFDDRAFYDLFSTDRALWSTPVRQQRVPGAAEPFDAWLTSAARVDY
ncbi:nucleoside deaminase [Kineococcus indalonis]|uniref:nucleoside deaminase n=1 Tax=Kineococcus indalonis TaxID=2696566 RepID=UPI0014121AA2|nr:nucleoside deaminase [Kineococcus indalonis]NAZ88049.1 nucleoside deaminase [Kineococcus indalonis]